MSIFDQPEAEYTKAQEIHRGREAERLLTNELFGEAVTEAEWELVRQWASAKSTPEHREACYSALHGLDLISKHLRVIAERGIIAQQSVNA